MTDVVDESQRSWIMSRVRSKDTKPELIVRSLLHRRGYRFSLRRKDLPGRPDVVMPKYRTVIFVHGCFWHRHPGCKRATMPATRVDFWTDKFTKTVARDAAAVCELRKTGWQVVTLWECEILQDPIACVDRIVEHLPDAPAANDPRSRSQILRDADHRLHYELDRHSPRRPPG